MSCCSCIPVRPDTSSLGPPRPAQLRDQRPTLGVHVRREVEVHSEDALTGRLLTIKTPAESLLILFYEATRLYIYIYTLYIVS